MTTKKFRKKQEGNNLTPESYDGYDFTFKMVQDFRNRIGMLDSNPVLTAKVVDVIELTPESQQSFIKFVVVAKIDDLDDALPLEPDNTKYKTKTNIISMSHFVPADETLQRPEIGQKVYVQFTDTNNRLGGLYKGPVESFSLIDVVTDVFKGIFPPSNAPSNPPVSSKATFAAARGTNSTKRMTEFRPQTHPNPNNGAARDTLNIARSYGDGGGYRWPAGNSNAGSGCPDTIAHKGNIIINKSTDGTTYCSGFTFAVLMKTAEKRGLLNSLDLVAVRNLQKDWYGFGPNTDGENLVASALQASQIGFNISKDEAQPGDFLQLWRTNNSGHSTVFVEWVLEQGQKIGLKYRSTQTSTNGIGDRIEYFTGFKGGSLDPNRLYFARLL